jgi:DNA-binding GntR family transcriptional regulator
VPATGSFDHGVGLAGLGERVHDRLEREIVAGDRTPGQVLREADLAEELGVSRTPVREALRRLAESGLVRGAGARGYRVAPVDVDLLAETGYVFAELCGTAARLAAPHLSADDVRWLADVQRHVMVEAVEHLPAEQLFAVEVADLIVQRADNSVLGQTIRRLQLHVIRATNLYGHQIPRERQAERGGAILGAVRVGDAELLALTVRVHFLQTVHDLIDIARGSHAHATGRAGGA